MNEKNPSNHRLSRSRSYRWVPNSARVHVCMVFTPFLSLKRPLYVWMQTPSFPLEVNPALLGQWEGSHVRVGDLQGRLAAQKKSNSFEYRNMRSHTISNRSDSTTQRVTKKKEFAFSTRNFNYFSCGPGFWWS